MTPEQAARELERRQKQLKQELAEANLRDLQDAARFAQAASSGPYQPPDLARAGHPYAKAHPDNAFDPALINARAGTGRLRASWKLAVSNVGGKLLGRLFNTAPEAVFFDEQASAGGTKFMRARPIQALIRKAVRRSRLLRLKASVRKALKL